MHFVSALVILTTQVLSQAGDVLSGVPDPPENIMLVSKSSRSVNISWSDGNNDTEDYKVHIKSQGKYVTGILCDHRDTQSSDGCNVTAKRVYIRGLNPFTGYQITVLARNDAGPSDESSQLNFTTNEEEPEAPPSNVQAHNTSSTSILVQWDDVPKADQNGIIQGYRVKYKALPSGKETSKIASERNETLGNLNEFTKYNICVLAFTVKGDGPMNCTVETTAEDKPAAPPDNVTGHNTSTKSILVQWDEVPEADQNGKIEGYRVVYRHLTNGQGNSTTVNDSTYRLEITKLEGSAKYNICVLAFTVKGNGPKDCIVLGTAQYRPAKAPIGIQTHNTTSTSTLVKWKEVSPAEQNEIIKGYRVKYKVLNTSEELTETVNGSKKTELLLDELNEYTQYSICVLAFTVGGDGPMNCTVVTTAQDKPAKPPSNIRAHTTNSTSILVQWDDVPHSDQNGIIKGHRVKYKVLNTSEELTETVNGSEKTELLLDELNEYTQYSICVLAFTVKGDGPMNCTVMTTAQDRPAKAPTDIQTQNTTSTSTLVKWKEVSPAEQNGIIKGYRVKYKVLNTNEELTETVNGSEKTELLLDELNEYTQYSICVLAFTVAGDGPMNCTAVTTAQDKPAAPPDNVTGHNTSTKSILVQWDEVPEADQNGKIEGYRVVYRHLTNGQGNSTTVNDSTYRLEITKLEGSAKYNICVLAFTVKGNGPKDCIVLGTAQYRPAKAPAGIQIQNTTSTSTLVKWKEVSPAEQYGIIIGYRVKYKVLNTNEELTETVNGSEKTELILDELNEYTQYSICVLAFTVTKNGSMNCTVVTTAQDKPAAPPDNVTGHNTSTKSILIQWDEVPEADQNGKIEGYRVVYRHLTNGQGNSTTVNDSTYRLEITKLEGSAKYNICVLAFTVKGNGPKDCIVLGTAQYRPAKAPAAIQIQNTTSTSTLVKWKEVSPAEQYGIIIGYRVKYKVLNTNEELTETVNGSEKTELLLDELNEYTQYSICVLAFTVTKDGSMNCTVVTTAQDKPAAPPDNVTGHNTSTKSILVQWDEVPEADQNGKIEGYRVVYRHLTNGQGNSTTVNDSTYRLEITKLEGSAKYNICVLAFTVKGNGPKDCIVLGTAQYRPAKAPAAIQIQNTTSTSTLVKWKEVSPAEQYGIIIGYRVKYKVLNTSEELTETVNGSEKTELILDELNEYTQYSICVLAFTVAGDGSMNCTVVTTAQDKPAAPPDNVTGHNTSTKSILVQWDEVPEADQNGKIEGYRVVYRHLTNGQGNSTTVNDSTYRLEITKLEGSAKYNICVLAFTTKGYGPQECVTVPTAEKARPKIKSCQERSDVLMKCDVKCTEKSDCNGVKCKENVAFVWSFEDGKQFIENDTHNKELWVKDVKQNNKSEGIYTCKVKENPEEFKELYLNVTDGPVNCTFHNGSWMCPNDTQLSSVPFSPVSGESPWPWEIIGPLLGSGFLGVAICAGWFLRRRYKNASAAKDTPEEPPQVPPQVRRRRPSDPWEVLEEDVFIQGFLGVGAFGEVWRAVVQHVGGIKGNRECAVKKLRGCVSSDTRKKFMKEIELMKMLSEQRHPNVVRFRGCVTRSETLMIIMEYTPYGDLLGFMRKSRGVADKHHTGEGLHVRELNNYDLVRFAQQIACGMEYIKSRGIMHRDLAARNVLVTTKFICKITDFGMAFQTDRYGYGAAKRGRIPIKWTAPEVLFETSTFQVSSKSDVWSYGILLYEIFTLGGTPYDGFREADVMAHLQNKNYRIPQPNHVSESIYAIMAQCWSEDPDDRPTFEELNTIFLDCITGEYYVEVLNMEKYESELYQPEQFVSDGDNLAEQTNSLQTETKPRSASEQNLRTDDANTLSTADKGFVSESDLPVLKITFADPVKKEPVQSVLDSDLSIDSLDSQESIAIEKVINGATPLVSEIENSLYMT